MKVQTFGKCQREEAASLTDDQYPTGPPGQQPPVHPDSQRREVMLYTQKKDQQATKMEEQLS